MMCCTLRSSAIDAGFTEDSHQTVRFHLQILNELNSDKKTTITFVLQEIQIDAKQKTTLDRPATSCQTLSPLAWTASQICPG